MVRPVSFTINGEPVRVTTDEDRMLLWVLRYDLGLTGTKFGCGEGLCGACSVIVGTEAVRSCSTKVKDIEGKQVLTIEGLSQDGHLHPLQGAFLERHAFQCGYCTSGMIVNAYALLLKKPRPTREEVVKAMDDNLCRCGSHTRILEAIDAAAAAMSGGVR
ncbi:MAG: (2Fe-2S)-binding protein [Acidobacteriia bacterium]|nr:(2Fe-2S)-binding protein [Terriglobia bacterium]